MRSSIVELENDYKIGYSENGFIVYGMISKETTTGMTQTQIIQECYKQVRSAFAYENARIADGKLPSMTYMPTVSDTMFVPEVSAAERVVLSGHTYYIPEEQTIGNYEAIVYSQYGDVLDVSVTWGISNNDLDFIDGVLSIDLVVEPIEFSITASVGLVTATIDVYIGAYVEPEPPPAPQPTSEERTELLENAVDFILMNF